MTLELLAPTLHCWFRIYGPRLSPGVITEATGVTPLRAWLPGHGRQATNPRAAYGRHGYWSWQGLEGDDPEPLLDEWHRLFRTTAGNLVDVLHEDDDVLLSLSGDVPAWPVLRVEQIAGMHVVGEGFNPRYSPEQFAPFLDARRLDVVLNREHIDLLSRLRCSFSTDIDYELLTEDG